MAGWEWASSCRKPGQKGLGDPELGQHHRHPAHSQNQEPHQSRKRGEKNNQSMSVMQLLPQQEGSRRCKRGRHLEQHSLLKDRRAEQPESKRLAAAPCSVVSEKNHCRAGITECPPSLCHAPTLWAASLADRQVYPGFTRYSGYNHNLTKDFSTCLSSGMQRAPLCSTGQ